VLFGIEIEIGIEIAPLIAVVRVSASS